MGKSAVMAAVAVALTAVLFLCIARAHADGLRLSWPDVCATLPLAFRPLVPICSGCSFCAPPSTVLLQELLPHLEARAALVTVVRDDRNIPHVYGERDSDVAFGLGYVQSEDHFTAVQELVLKSKCRSSLLAGGNMREGKNGERGGPLSRNGLQSDSLCLMFEFDRQVEEGYDRQLSEGGKELLSSFAAGVNYYAATHTDEILFDDVSLLFPLNGRDIALTTVARLPFLMEIEPILDLLLQEDPYYVVSFATEELEHDDSAGAIHSSQFSSYAASDAASTAYAVGSQLTADSSTVLAMNPHYLWDGPFRLYEAHAHSKEGWDAYGGMWLAGPAFPMAATPALAWAHTVNFPDLVDVYLMDVDEAFPAMVYIDGEAVPLREETHELREHVWGPFYRHHQVTHQYSPYGPVLKRNHGTYSLRWAGFGRVGQQEQLHEMSKARSLAEWQSAVERRDLPLFTFLYADAEDNVLLTYNGLLPKRDEGYLWQVMVDGSSSRTLWDTYDDNGVLPRVLNPSPAFLVAANSSPFNCTARASPARGGEGHNPTPEAFAFEHGIEGHLTNRASRLLHLLDRPGHRYTWEELAALKWDEEYAEEAGIIGVLVHVVDKLRDLQYSSPQVAANATISAAVDLLASWDRRADAANPAAALAVLTASPFIRRGASDPLDYVRKNFVVVIQRFLEVATSLEREFGRLDVPWGEVQRLRRHGRDLHLGGAPDVLHTVYAREAEEGKVEATGGDGLVLMVAYRPTDDGSRLLHGESLSEDHSEAMAATAPSEIRFYDEDVRRHTTARYTPLERSPA